ncbi:CaiB/BaiF CoA transferase family protein [Aquibaculum arenosum]|uniref:CaiB/BaiF CoA-transferase family protein n=1 Tax=Aquibaculum arenosum TaxID=3032591 RepID=A0ABT5YNG3_9PROT|nr:CaiB/BaiF CoA-transferase family protein [Fodinicurvata sp. CAU 1616]MDF2095784.1 CaiB/BaiF CoA-transferase family protein [Fodinicurvata sp. CAU 1616]
MSGPLSGLRILDLTRILAGPTSTQLLGDLGADVIKIERPGEGDDTRRWGPPYVKNADGSDSDASAYYLSSNRNKRSLTVDIAAPEGQALIRRLAASCDVVAENFKVGGLAKFGLDYLSMKEVKPDIVYCSITGFGQTGPYAPRAGYDYLAQGMGGMMSITGEPDGQPMKVGVGIADVMCGMYASVAILAALRHRDRTGQGQYIDLALLDTQVAWLVNEGLNYLTSGKVPHRRGTEHANIVPYNVLPCADGHFIIAVGNDRQFQRFCAFAGAPELGEDPRFLTNSLRVANRDALYDLLPELTRRKTLDEWVNGLAELGVPSGPVNTIDRVFADPQILHRGMKVSLPFPGSETGTVDLIGNPIKFSETPVAYRRPPPRVGEHSEEVLREFGLSEDEIAKLRDKGIV